MNDHDLTHQHSADDSDGDDEAVISLSKYRTMVLGAEQALTALRNSHSAEQREMQRRQRKELEPHEDVLKQIVAKFKGAAIDISIKLDKAPYCKWGGRETPDQIRPEPDGLKLVWDINGDYAPDTFLVTWEMLDAH